MDGARMIIRLLIACACVLFLSCGDESAPRGANRSTTQPSSFQIAVISGGRDDAFRRALEAGAVEAGHELAAAVISKAPLRDDDPEEQANLIRQFVTQRVDGIIIASHNPAALTAPIRESIEAAIPIVLIDTALTESAKATGSGSIKILVDHLEDRAKDDTAAPGVILITRENVDSSAIRSILESSD